MTNGWPKIFQAWNGADTPLSEPAIETIARHDLWFHVPEAFEVYWEGRSGKFTRPMLTGRFDTGSLAAGRNMKAELKRLNPDILLLTEIGYTEGAFDQTDFPENHPWWMRDRSGNHVRGWGEGASQDYKLDLSNADYRQHIAVCAKAAIATGIWDGVMFDVWSDDDFHLDIIKRVRAEIGEIPLILCNNNYNLSPKTIGYMNGMFMECGQNPAWKQVMDTLDFNEGRVKNPKINCLEISYSANRNDYKLMRATTCLALTHSDGYALFSDPNSLPSPDHLHSWYKFWDRSLGRPNGRYFIGQDGMHKRNYEKGMAVFNPPGNPNSVINLSKAMKSVVSSTVHDRFILESPDGGIYLNP